MDTTHQFELGAQLRSHLGKGASRRLRRTGQVPAILYGAGKEPTALTLSHNELLRHLEYEAFYSHILTVNVENQTEKAVLKALHRHPSDPTILHVDLQRVSETAKLHMHVPLHFVNEAACPGVKQGGIITRQAIEVEIHCLPKDLPEFIEVDLSKLSIGDIIHLTDLVLPAGVELVGAIQESEHNLPVVSIHIPRAAHAEEVVKQEVKEEVKTETKPAEAPKGKEGK